MTNIDNKYKAKRFEKKWPRKNPPDLRGKQSLNPGSYEEKWQKKWQEKGIYKPDLNKAKNPFYNLMMFPYPSASGLHVGNMYAFTGADIFGRFMRMKGYQVFEPIGLDGFGIHSENYAIKIGRHPLKQAKISEKNFYRQLRSIGNGFAWENTLETYDCNYYKWTQWIFVKMFKAGLAYRKKSPLNFCPSCKTVLADEQVIQGVCERCKTIVEKKDMAQWFFKITDYADRLLEGLTKINWSKKVKIAQRNWIGKKEGINIDYQVADRYGNPITRLNLVWEQGDGPNITKPVTITCFTTRPDTNFGATFVVLAPEHPFATLLCRSNSKFKIQNSKLKEIKTPRMVAGKRGERAMTPPRWRDIKNYIDKAKKKSDIERIAQGREKTGVFTGFYCINDLTGYKMPVWISDFVLMDVGTGAVVGVPGHDKRDFEFAQKFDLEVIRVVVGRDCDTSPITRIEQVQEEEGTMINSQFLDGLDIHQATQKIMDYMEEKGQGRRVTSYRLRDWCISRQRYWGPPIPMIYCSSCAKKDLGWLSLYGVKPQELGIKNQESRGNKSILNSKFLIRDSDLMPGWYPVPEKDLPVKLPYIKNYQPKGTGESPLVQDKKFVEAKCPHCGSTARRETDVSDTFLDSAWYFLRYPSVGIQNSKFKTQSYNVKLPGNNVALCNVKLRGNNVALRNSKFKNKKIEIIKTPQRWSCRAGTPPTVEGSEDHPWDSQITKKWLPVHMYIGGAEHSVLHLLYSRFLTMALHDMGYLHFEEPFTRFYAHGLIIAEGAKMSKSKGNIVIPDEYIKKYGADALRTYLMFLGPFDQGGDFRDTGISGMYRFLARVWRLVNEYSQKSKLQVTTKNYRENSSISLLGFMHKTIKEVTEDLENLRYNTAIAHIMEYVNELTDNRQLTTDNHIKSLLLMLAPFVPHMTEELWQELRHLGGGRLESPKDTPGVAGRSVSKGHDSPEVKELNKTHNTQPQPTTYNSIHLHPWPTYDPKYLKEEEVTIVVQVNGKKRDAIKVKSQKSKVKSHVEEEAKKSKKVQKYISGKKIKKTIFVPSRLINFVI